MPFVDLINFFASVAGLAVIAYHVTVYAFELYKKSPRSGNKWEKIGRTRNYWFLDGSYRKGTPILTLNYDAELEAAFLKKTF
jgi:hypothetical protein